MKISRIIWLPATVGLVVVIGIVVWLVCRNGSSSEGEIVVVEEPVELLYGIEKGKYDITEGEFASGETIGALLGRYGIGPGKVDSIARVAEPVFSMRNLRAGHPYVVFQTRDSVGPKKLAYFVYEATTTDYLVIDLTDSIRVHKAAKDVTVQRQKRSASITSSLWKSMTDNDMSPALAMELSEIYAWTIDFFALQPEDNFTVIYDQKYVDSTNVGLGAIWGARFEHGGKTYYAIPFLQDGKLGYWDENGNSLRKALLKAPLKFSRISSRFSNSRLHPVLRIRRPHHGVDYAAPSGTPVHAIGDGVVIYKGWSGGGGNTLKIKHNVGSLTSGYLHLKAYAKGISKGTRVKQGDLIGYVGATGLATGPHLDFRIWRGSTPIDPLKVPSEPAEPIRQGNRTAFNVVKERIMAELSGDVADSLKVTSLELDSLCKAIPNTATPVAPAPDKDTPAKPAAPAAEK